MSKLVVLKEGDKMRLIVQNKPQTALECLAIDDALRQMRISDEIPDTVFLWRPTKFIYVLKNASVDHVNRQYAEDCGYPVMRSATIVGKEDSLVIVGDMWNLITSIKPTLDKKEHIYNYGQGAWIYIINKLGLKLEAKGNDLVVLGTDRKLSGFACDTSYPKSIFMNCFLSEKLPKNVDLNKLFILQQSKFKDKSVNSAEERVTSIEKEINTTLSQEWLEGALVEYFSTIGVTLEKTDFTQKEKEFAKKLEAKHLSEEWIVYGREKPDFS